MSTKRLRVLIKLKHQTLRQTFNTNISSIRLSYTVHKKLFPTHFKTTIFMRPESSYIINILKWNRTQKGWIHSDLCQTKVSMYIRVCSTDIVDYIYQIMFRFFYSYYICRFYKFCNPILRYRTLLNRYVFAHLQNLRCA